MGLIRSIALVTELILCYAATLWVLCGSKHYRVNVYELDDFLSHKLVDNDEQQLEDVLVNLHICNKWSENKEKINYMQIRL